METEVAHNALLVGLLQAQEQSNFIPLLQAKYSYFSVIKYI
jgi:hypothetical protein